jgi:hypothetical protein
MPELALQAHASCGSLYNTSDDKQSLFRSASVQSVDQSFGPAIHAAHRRLSPFRPIESILAEAIDICAHPARNDGTPLLRAGIAAGTIDMDRGATVPEIIEQIERYLTDCAAARQTDRGNICTQPATDLCDLLLTTLLSLTFLFRLRPERKRLEEIVRPTLHQLRALKIRYTRTGQLLHRSRCPSAMAK